MATVNRLPQNVPPTKGWWGEIKEKWLELGAILAGIIFVVLATYRSFLMFFNDPSAVPFAAQNWLVFLLVGYFPLTYIAYNRVRAPMRIKRLENDLRLLGYEQDQQTIIAHKRVRAPMRIKRLENDLRLLGYEQDQQTSNKDELDAKTLYETVHDPLSYILFILFTMFVTGVAASWLITLPDAGAKGINLDVDTLRAMRYGFLGAYLFSAYLVYRRHSTDDLQPMVYLYCAFTIFAGVIFNYVAFEAVTSISGSSTVATSGVGAGLIAIISFSLGYFPYLAVRWFNDLAFRTLQVGKRRADSLPLSLIDGISEWHETRLRDNGIDDIQNLASVEIRSLLVNTPFSSQEVVAWVDQANLYLYLDPNEIESFRRGKINMLSDFHAMWKQCGDDKDKINALAQQLQTTPEKLQMLYVATQEGPNVHRVLGYWPACADEVHLIRKEVKEIAEKQHKELSDELNKLIFPPKGKDEQTLLAPKELHERVMQNYLNVLELLETSPKAEFLTDLGLVTSFFDKYDEAIKYYNPAIEKNANVRTIYARAVAYYCSGDYNKAIDDYSTCLQNTDKPDSRYYVKRAQAYWYAGDIDNAIADFEKAINDDQALDETSREAHYNLGVILRQNHKFLEAEEQIKYVLDRDPNNPYAKNELAYLYCQSGEHLDQANELVEDAIHFSTKLENYPDPSFLDTLATVQIKQARACQDEQIRLKLLGQAATNMQKVLYSQKIDVEWYPEVIKEHLGDLVTQMINLASMTADVCTNHNLIDRAEGLLIDAHCLPNCPSELTIVIDEHLKHLYACRK